ncbi:MAG: TrkA family potassium uptake protein [Coriobacteriaceae bacterium]|nr:TrkA family potassium uptake protein [Coriobacteriaceae bacterium]MDO4889884.1 TrkA family potassium uptake protein [Coriobacteriaceae bacterium]
MSDIIVVGCGRVGSQLATQLSQSDNNVTVIDRDVASFANLGPDFNGATIQGVGFDEDVLMEAGIKSCDAVAAVTQLDNTNLMIAEVCEKLYGVPHVVARLHDPSHERAYSLLGIDYSCGTTLVAEEIYAKLQSGHGNHVKSFGDVEIIEFTLNLRSHLRQTMRVSELERPHGARVVAFERADGSATSIPDGDSILYDGDKLLVCIRSELLAAFEKFMRQD